MLTHIYVRNIAIVDELELDLRPGMTVLTGETGAGKSVLLDALGLALGDRADAGMVRHGSDRAEIAVSFSVAGCPDAQAWLQENDLDTGEECLVRRVVSADGRSRAYINGQPAQVQSLRTLGELLVDLHGQHAHQSLLRRDVQRQLLDDFAGHGGLLEELGGLYQRWRELKAQCETLQSADRERDERMTLLRFQLEELDALALGERELPELNEEHGRLANAGRLLETCERGLALLYDGEEVNAASLLEEVGADLQRVQQFEPRLSACVELLTNATIQVQEAASELRHYLSGLDMDPQRLEWVEQRLAAIHDLARKHRVAPEELPALHQRLREELAGWEDSDQRLESLQRELRALEDQYRERAARLSESRAAAADRLGSQVTDNMQQLGMQGGRFGIVLHAREQDSFSPTGLEQVEFMVSANPGQPAKPLAKVASGGELSRISLAIQVIAASSARIPTLVFDEVDVGIGGGVAEIVGRQLQALGRHRQVLCVTHLPQVAALGDQHLQVVKSTDGESTTTGFRLLSPQDRVEEIARMLGGLEITDQTLAHAREMIERAADPARAARRA